MTTQQPSGYPTAPPWAPPQQAGPHNAAPWTGHPRLLVPYPEEMAKAGRPRPPAWWPVVIWTIVLWPVGAVSATRRARKARMRRNEQHPYWIAFGVTLALMAVLATTVKASNIL